VYYLIYIALTEKCLTYLASRQQLEELARRTENLDNVPLGRKEICCMSSYAVFGDILDGLKWLVRGARDGRNNKPSVRTQGFGRS
jgi:hypothetical protein